MDRNRPIGIFDSGVGGTSIWKEIHQLLPMENTIYLADSKNAPYGNKSREEILKLSIKNTEKLISLNCKIIVVACNTATTNTIDQLREAYNLPFIGIEPAIKPAALQSHSKKIGVLATKGTLTSDLFSNTHRTYTKDIEVVEVVGEGLVPLIESGNLNGPEMESLLKKHIRPFVEADIDFLVLGCTHYPYLIPLLKKLLPAHITIIDSGYAVAKQTKAVLKSENLLRNRPGASKPVFYSNKNTGTLHFLLKDYSKSVEIEVCDF